MQRIAMLAVGLVAWSRRGGSRHRSQSPGRKIATTTVKAPNPTTGQVAPPADQFELYNLTTDPTEMTDLAGNFAYADVQGEMQTLLNAQRSEKRLSPVIQPWADGTMKQFAFTPG